MATLDMSVIIPTYNRIEALSKVLGNLEEQIIDTQSINWELIIVDNNSSDGTNNVVMEWKNKGSLPIRYIFEPRQGRSFALNVGIKEARSPLLVFTDDDVVLDVHWLSSFYEASRKYQHNVIGGRTLPLLDTALPEWLTIEGPNSRAMNGPFVRHDRGDKVKEYDESMNAPFGCNVMVRKEIFEKHGLFNTSLGMSRGKDRIGGEDQEFFYRIKAKGEMLLYDPSILVHHPVPAERLEKQYFKRYYWGSGREIVLSKVAKTAKNNQTKIPMYMIKNAIIAMLRLLIALPGTDKPKKFYRELQLLYLLGTIFEHYMNEN